MLDFSRPETVPLLMPMDVIFGRRAGRKRRSTFVSLPVEVDGSRPAPTIGQRSDAAKGINQHCEPRPTDAVLLAVLEPGDHGLVDARICLEDPLAPTEGQAATPDLDPDEIETMLLLRVSRPIEPRHATKVANTTYLAAIRRSIVDQPVFDI